MRGSAALSQSITSLASFVAIFLLSLSFRFGNRVRQQNREFSSRIMDCAFAGDSQKPLGTNADDCLSPPFGTVEGGARIIEGSHAADVGSQLSNAESLNELI